MCLGSNGAGFYRNLKKCTKKDWSWLDRVKQDGETKIVNHKGILNQIIYHLKAISSNFKKVLKVAKSVSWKPFMLFEEALGYTREA